MIVNDATDRSGWDQSFLEPAAAPVIGSGTPFGSRTPPVYALAGDDLTDQRPTTPDDKTIRYRTGEVVRFFPAGMRGANSPTVELLGGEEGCGDCDGARESSFKNGKVFQEIKGCEGLSDSCDHLRGDSSKGDWSRGDWSRSDSLTGNWSRYDLPRGESSKGDWSMRDSSRGDSLRGASSKDDFLENYSLRDNSSRDDTTHDTDSLREISSRYNFSPVEVLNDGSTLSCHLPMQNDLDRCVNASVAKDEMRNSTFNYSDHCYMNSDSRNAGANSVADKLLDSTHSDLSMDLASTVSSEIPVSRKPAAVSSHVMVTRSSADCQNAVALSGELTSSLPLDMLSKIPQALTTIISPISHSSVSVKYPVARITASSLDSSSAANAPFSDRIATSTPWLQSNGDARQIESTHHPIHPSTNDVHNAEKESKESQTRVVAFLSRSNSDTGSFPSAVSLRNNLSSSDISIAFPRRFISIPPHLSLLEHSHLDSSCPANWTKSEATAYPTPPSDSLTDRSPGPDHRFPGPNHRSQGPDHRSPGPDHRSPGPDHQITDETAYNRAVRFLAATWDLHGLETVFSRLAACGFYHGRMTIDEANHRLGVCSVGTFLLRDSSDARFLFALSVQTRRGTTSIRIAYRAGLFRLDCSVEQTHLMPTFDCVLALVRYYVILSRSRYGLDSRSNYVFMESTGRRDTPVVLWRALEGSPAKLAHMCRRRVHGLLVGRGVERLQLTPSLKKYLNDYPYDF